MPRRIQWHDQAWQQLLQLPEQMRKEALTAAGALMADPLPAGSQTYEAVPDTYKLAAGNVSLYYRIVGEEVDIVLVAPNS